MICVTNLLLLGQSMIPDFSRETLAFVWFVLLAVLLIGYAILDGFDLGVGILHPFVAQNDHERRLVMNSIGPLWDGNEVWLVTFGGALFAAFPEAYATVFSGFYLALMLLLCALILRAVSLEFRGKVHSPRWRKAWDLMFFAGSTLATFLFGVAVGNMMLGVPLDGNHEFVGRFTELLNPYSLAVGIMAVLAFALHGSIYLYLKTEGEFQQRLRPVMWRMFFLFAAFYAVITTWTAIAAPRSLTTLNEMPILWVVPILNLLAVLNIPRAIHKGIEGHAFFSSSCMIAALVFLFITALFPFLVPASNDPSHSLTILNAASSQKTLKIMLLIALLGLPCVLTYSGVIYWTFRGKVKLDETSY
ncbi:cytochrome d ubiquinol oxidase subunit II [Novipirellula artificiosorum]|uniref:Cytochrome bd-II ubiquinol oxidase subunit 2 n=1 Tax=Novipirellula artificiosorum TaxID=2528016 RepID=A0A5C6D8B2_9BACT|nr:cytochrome d ubiquinol oxidase subunit II [Novipirellula artificiosorum]TWU32001.1 Cytochrome bd-II ubiquinol oxidase subunit 2 [Novipirellula artificiosorum]